MFGDINWESVSNSVLNTFARFAVVYIAFFLSRVLTEIFRKDTRKSHVLQGMEAFGISLLVVTGIAFALWIDFFGGMANEETGEVTPMSSPKHAHALAVKTFITLLIPVLWGTYKGFKTPASELATKYPESSHLDDDYT